MKLLYKLTVFFLVIYGALFCHHAIYNQAQKVQVIQALSAEVKVCEPSFSFRSIAYKRFVYAD